MDEIKEENALIQSVALSTDVITLKFIANFLLFGIGNKIHCYDWKRKLLLEAATVFNSTHSVYGIRLMSETIDQMTLLIFGGKSVRIYDFFVKKLSSRLVPITKEYIHSDWIHDAISTASGTDNTVVLLTAHNSIILWNWKEARILQEYHFTEKCILYSGRILWSSSRFIFLAAGTVFKEIVTWYIDVQNDGAGSKYSAVHRLTGHQGVVFSITYNECLNLLCSTSDDRSMRIWRFMQNSSPSGCSESETSFLDSYLHGSFELIHVCFGHESRVWSSLILEEFIISIGEDSTVCFWNHEGSLLNREKCHNGGSVWCVDSCSTNSLIATGGSDSGVILWDLNQIIQSPPKLLALNTKLDFPNDFPRTVQLVTENGECLLLVTTDMGRLLMYNLQEEAWVFEHVNETYSSYCLPSVSLDQKVLLIGTLQGEIHSFLLDQENVICSSEIPVSKGKVNGIHWTNGDSKFVLTCGANGEMSFWSVDQKDRCISLSLIKHLFLPKNNRHWWSTVACFIPSLDVLLVGDRGGSLHIYNNVSAESSATVQQHPSVTHFGIHSRTGVTDIKVRDNQVFSSGRDGKLIVYKASAEGIQGLHYMKVPHNVEWIGRTLFWSDDLILLGFHSKDFIVWSTKQQRCLMNVPCGGGHRSWDWSIASDQSATFAAIKRKEILIFKRNLTSLLELSPPFYGIFGMPVRCICYISSIKKGDVSIVACGGEDPTLKIIGLNESSHSSMQENMFLVHNISSHLSNIRAIAKCQMDSSGDFLLISAGGRAQMCSWKVSCQTDVTCQHVASDFLWNVDKPSNKPWKEKHKQVPDPQTRYMDVSVWPHKRNEYFIASACSDSFVRIHILDIEAKVFKIVAVVEHGEHCVLKMSLLNCENPFGYLLATAATDGFLKIFSGRVDGIIDQHNDVTHSKIPILQKQLHQSGVNALDIRQLNGLSWVICTGGDDNSISISIVEVQNLDTEIPIIIHSTGSVKQAHASQISGIKFLSEGSFVSASIDQRINLWHWQQSEEEIKLRLVWSKISYVADISNLEVWKNELSRTWHAVVCGEGLEYFNIFQI